MAKLNSVLFSLTLLALAVSLPARPVDAQFRLATFSVDVTCPLGSALLAGRVRAKEIVDPLYAKGLVLLGAGPPVVLCSVDWCEIRNQSYDLWRERLAAAAGTSRQRVLLTSVHQHDAPVTDIGAAELLAEVGLAGAMFDPQFEMTCIKRTAEALRESLANSRQVTHLAVGKAKVERIASNRRVVRADGSVTYGRGSNSGGSRAYREAPDGTIDPWLRTLSFFDGATQLAALHAYATHPMSYYGAGGVSYDFVGQARELMQRDHPDVLQIYVSGCSGDVTAGRYNDGSPANRARLAQRLYDAMNAAQADSRKQSLAKVEFHTTPLELPFRVDESHTTQALQRRLNNSKLDTRNRVLAAMGLASRQRVESGQAIDFCCLSLGPAQLVLFPGEAFVQYQLTAQQMRPEAFVLAVGYGECWPGYIPSKQAFDDNFTDKWYWVAPVSDQLIEAALQRILPE